MWVGSPRSPDPGTSASPCARRGTRTRRNERRRRTRSRQMHATSMRNGILLGRSTDAPSFDRPSLRRSNMPCTKIPPDRGAARGGRRAVGGARRAGWRPERLGLRARAATASRPLRAVCTDATIVSHPSAAERRRAEMDFDALIRPELAPMVPYAPGLRASEVARAVRRGRSSASSPATRTLRARSRAPSERWKPCSHGSTSTATARSSRCGALAEHLGVPIEHRGRQRQQRAAAPDRAGGPATRGRDASSHGRASSSTRWSHSSWVRPR